LEIQEDFFGIIRKLGAGLTIYRVSIPVAEGGGDRLGGLIVPGELKDKVSKALKDLGYEIVEPASR